MIADLTAQHRAVVRIAWIDTWNEDPCPFVWHKTADEILDTLAQYCERISDSGH